MDESEFYKFIGFLEEKLRDDERTGNFIMILNEIMEMIEKASQEDFYGTEGYKHILGWD